MIKNSNSSQKQLIDPIGAEFVLTIFSTAVTVIAALHQFGTFSKPNKKVIKELRNLRNEVLRLQNSLDNFIKIYAKYNQKDINSEESTGSVTICDTLVNLKERDYVNWVDNRDSIEEIRNKIYSIIKKIRRLFIEQQDLATYEDIKFLRQFDELFLKISTISFGDFVRRLREQLDLLSMIINDTINNLT